MSINVKMYVYNFIVNACYTYSDPMLQCQMIDTFVTRWLLIYFTLHVNNMSIRKEINFQILLFSFQMNGYWLSRGKTTLITFYM